MAPRQSIVVCALAAALVACGKPKSTPAPPADLLVSTPDSAFWITSDQRGLRMRGVPMHLARVDGRFEELYVADDDRSYFDAVFVGQRLFMRDLVRGDSVEILADSLVPRLAHEYAAANPRETRLRPGEDASDHPGTTATADLEILGVYGPYLSYEYRTDVDVTDSRGDMDRHAARRGVLDLRTGAHVTLGKLFGRATADELIAKAAAEWARARDSLMNRQDPESRRAQRTAVSFVFDPSSFTIEAFDGEPQVLFGVPGVVKGGSAGALELSAQQVGAPDWWDGVRGELPEGPDSARTWPHGRLELFARLIADAQRALLMLREPQLHTRRDARPMQLRDAQPLQPRDAQPLQLRDAQPLQWTVGSVTAPVERVIWLDSVNSEAKRALHHAFNEASMYSDDNRIAAIHAIRDSHIFLTNHVTAQTPIAHRSRIAARHLGVDDADGRERPGARIRRGDTRNGGQDRGGMRHPPLALDVRDRVGGPRGLSPADSRGRAGPHEGERELRGTLVDGNRDPDRGREHAHRRPPSHQLVLHDVRRN
jgi:hypothetical protein